MLDFNFSIPTKVLFGAGRLDELKREPLPGKFALVVISDGTTVKKSGCLDRVLAALKHQGIEYLIFDKVRSNPSKASVMEAAQIARDNFCDFVIGVGGSSAIDAAKGAALMARNPGDLWDYIVTGSGKGKAVKNHALPIIAVITTSGSGTEVNPWLDVTEENLHEKIGFGVPSTFPTLSIVDPELVLTVPSFLTAVQGFDAFFHAAEGFIAKSATPISEAFSLQVIRLISKNLPQAVHDGSDIEARTNIALAGLLSGMVQVTSSCTSEHSMEHAMSAFHPELPHGAGMLMISEAYFSFFAKYVPDRFIKMAHMMGETTDGLPEEEKPYTFVRALQKLKKKCGVDGLKMSDYGIRDDEMEALARNAHKTMSNLFAMDRYTLSLQENMDIFKASYR
ncbi:MAG: iron-containing alcohol dehydrogenase [Alphaproteobacteria bacterium]|nr:iron-containing alcohol dehydrogenase [Alphaproteobacteria bacterium]MBO4643418.1 iron-containing alcohol dehydrogenase [Alphaproteobacteria bacterium]